MPPQRKVDLVFDSVKRLLRVGATANLSNLLQKQHPADLAQIFGELADRDRIAAFSVLVERNSRLAMETLSELGPETGAHLLAGRSAEEIDKLVQELPSDDAAALIDNLPEALPSAGKLVDPEFVRDMIRSGKAVKLKPGQKLPEDAEYELRVENGATRLIHHRVASR